jgi:cell division protein FtsW
MSVDPSKKYFLPISFLFLAIVLALFGVLMIYNASTSWARAQSQLLWFALALGAGVFTASIDYRFWKKMAWPLYIASVILLVIVLIPGVGDSTFGAQRWIRLPELPLLGPIGFQPAEVTKISLVLFFAAWFSKKDRKKDRYAFLGFLGFLGVIVLLIMLEPDLGTTIVTVSSVLVIYVLAREPMKYIYMLAPLMLGGVILLIMMAPYRMERLQSYFHFWSDPFDTPDQLGSTYHIRQAIIGIGSGGLTGVGPGQSLQKYGYLPFAETDSIFAVIGEEFGFIGMTVFLFVILLFFRQGFLIADKADEDYGRLVASGFITWFAVQVLLNIGAMSVLIPFTGVPLLFVSYGGSALVVGFVAVGILMNIAIQTSRNQGIRSLHTKHK